MSNGPFDSRLGQITDPSDWNNTSIPLLSQLESLQRCYICKDFLLAPVVTSCNHTFCSTCIRQHLMAKNTCPLCQSEQFESNLRRVVVLEEIVNCFTELRPYILEKLKHSDSNQNAPQPHSTPDKSSETEDVFLPQKRKYEPLSSDQSNSDVVVIEDDQPKEDDGKEQEEDERKKRLKLESGEAQCPICSKWMDSNFLQSTHIDGCLNGRSSILPKDYKSKPSRKPITKPAKKEIASFFKPMKASKDPNQALKINHQEFYFNNANKHNGRENRLPKLDFSSLTLTKLKDKLAAIGLSTLGTRNQLELRYNQYYILHNSNLDSNHPVDIRVIKLRLNKWESSHLAFNTPGTNLSSKLFSSNRSSLSGKSITDKNFPVGEWKRVYYQEFRDLKLQALKNKKKPKSKAVPKENQQNKDNEGQEVPVPENQEKLSQHCELPFDASPLFVGEND